MTAIIGNVLEMPFWPQGCISPSITTFTLDQSTDANEMVFQVPEDMTITRIGYYQGSRIGASSATYTVSLQGVDTGGNPDGTIKGGGSPASASITPFSGTNNTWQWVNLANSYAATRGQWLAIVIKYASGTIDASNNTSFGNTLGNAITFMAQPYAIQNNGGSRTRQGAGYPMYGIGTSTQAYGWPVNSISVATYNSGSTPDEKALLLNIPASMMAAYKIIGAVYYGNSASGMTFDVKLYDSSSNVLQAITIDSDFDVLASGARRRVFYFDDTPVALSAGSNYRLSILPNSVSNVAVNSIVVASAADLDAYLGGAAMAQGSTRTDAGAWTDSNVTRYAINPIIADLTGGGGGGAYQFHLGNSIGIGA